MIWDVKATRHDRFVRKHGAPVELAKPVGEAGTSQHPALYQKGPERGLLVPPVRTPDGAQAPIGSR